MFLQTAQPLHRAGGFLDEHQCGEQSRSPRRRVSRRREAGRGTAEGKSPWSRDRPPSGGRHDMAVRSLRNPGPPWACTPGLRCASAFCRVADAHRPRRRHRGRLLRQPVQSSTARSAAPRGARARPLPRHRLLRTCSHQGLWLVASGRSLAGGRPSRCPAVSTTAIGSPAAATANPTRRCTSSQSSRCASSSGAQRATSPSRLKTRQALPER